MITHYSVGGYPRDDNFAYWVVCHPAGVKRWCWSAMARDEVIAVLEECGSMANELDFNIVSERTAVELALLARERKGDRFCGFPLDEQGKGGHYS